MELGAKLHNQKGQVILILILVMTVALAIGISVIQRSLADISSSTKVEQSSRAFSAAQAGIEKALQIDTLIPQFDLGNNSVANVKKNDLIPAVVTGFRQAALECPPNSSSLAKEDLAQVWLAEYTSNTNPPPAYYKKDKLDIYWGNSVTDKAALELTLIYYGKDPTDLVDGTKDKYRSRKWYLDSDSGRIATNKFQSVDCRGGYSVDGTTTKFQCKYTIGSGDPIDTNGPLPTAPAVLMLLRGRLLYNEYPQPFAVQATNLTCGRDCSLPPQAKVITSQGNSGNTQRTLNVCQLRKVVPFYFDYAIFSAAKIEK